MTYKMYGNYRIYENGDVYSEIRNKYLKGEITRLGYLQYSLNINHEVRRIRAHQLVAKLFLGPPENSSYTMINHKDGNKLNNHYSNLEWCDAYFNNKHARDNGLNNISQSNHNRWQDNDFRARTSRNFSIIKTERGSSRGEHNGRFRYLATDGTGHTYSRQELSELIQKPIYTVDRNLKMAANGITYKPFSDLGIFVIDVKQKGQQTIESITQEKALCEEASRVHGVRNSHRGSAECLNDGNSRKTKI